MLLTQEAKYLRRFLILLLNIGFTWWFNVSKMFSGLSYLKSVKNCLLDYLDIDHSLTIPGEQKESQSVRIWWEELVYGTFLSYDVCFCDTNYNKFIKTLMNQFMRTIRYKFK